MCAACVCARVCACVCVCSLSYVLAVGSQPTGCGVSTTHDKYELVVPQECSHVVERLSPPLTRELDGFWSSRFLVGKTT